MNFYSASVALLWTTAMGLSAPAAHGSRETAATKKMPFIDVELPAPLGHTLAAARLASAARRLCARFRNSPQIARANTFALCVHEPTADALIRTSETGQGFYVARSHPTSDP
jgi:UrcA family protein